MSTTTIELPESFPGHMQTWVRREDGAGYDAICGRCEGTGYWSGPTYIDNGICFHCNGQKGALDTISNEKALQLYTAQVKRAERKEQKRLAVIAERDARVERLKATHPEVHAVLQEAYNTYQEDPYARVNGFFLDLGRQIFNAKGRDLTENQIAAVLRSISKKQEQEANAAPVEAGKQTITGEISSIKTVESDFGSAVKVVIKDDRGFRVYGTLAKSLVDELWGRWYAETVGSQDDGYGSILGDYGTEAWFETAKGARVKFDATVDASKDDKSFGFYKRPTKAEILA